VTHSTEHTLEIGLYSSSFSYQGKTIATLSSKFTESHKICWSDKATVFPVLLNFQLR